MKAGKALRLLGFAVVLLPLLACNVLPSLSPVQPSASPTPLAARGAPHPFDVAWDERTAFEAGLIEAERETLDGLAGASVYHIELQIPDDFTVLAGREQVHYTNQEHVSLDTVYFRLFPNIAGGAVTVSALTVDGREVEPVYELADSALRVPLPEALAPGDQAVFEMAFDVEVPREMGGNYGLFGYFDDVLVLDEFYPVIAVYDDEGWNVEVPPPMGDVTYLDAGLYLVRVIAPADVVVVASGVEIGRESDDGRQVLTYAAGPARDFYLAASERYTVVSERVGETVVNSYAFADREAGAELALSFAVDALESYGARFGAYPYAEFDVVSSPMLALGIEYPGIVGIALDVYELDREIRGLPSEVLLESVVAHEVAHQWFYNMVGNDQLDEPWLDEALAQYLTGLYYLDTAGEQAASGWRTSLEGRWDGVGRAAIPIGLPVRRYEGGEYGAIVYGRGPLFIEALAEEMGQEAFDTFLRDYATSYKWEIGTGDAFKTLAEEHCACDLTPLFEVWVYE